MHDQRFRNLCKLVLLWSSASASFRLRHYPLFHKQFQLRLSRHRAIHITHILRSSDFWLTHIILIQTTFNHLQNAIRQSTPAWLPISQLSSFLKPKPEPRSAQTTTRAHDLYLVLTTYNSYARVICRAHNLYLSSRDITRARLVSTRYKSWARLVSHGYESCSRVTGFFLLRISLLDFRIHFKTRQLRPTES